jgi:hypothetical protein
MHFNTLCSIPLLFSVSFYKTPLLCSAILCSVDYFLPIIPIDFSHFCPVNPFKSVILTVYFPLSSTQPKAINSELAHYISQLLWVSANVVWAGWELFDPNIDDKPYHLLDRYLHVSVYVCACLCMIVCMTFCLSE